MNSTDAGLPGAASRRIERLDGRGGRGWTRDALVVEAPLTLCRGGEALAVVMRTPGADSDVELARGLLFSEGVGGEDLAGVHRTGPDAVDVGAATLAPRALVASASCGVCGKESIADLEARLAPVSSPLVVTESVIAGLPARLRAAQELFGQTGGLHAAGLFDEHGVLLCLREDVGRHNAVDKVVGWALAAGAVPAGRAILCVSGRLGFEIAQKAVAAGVAVVAAVSAPSSLAVDLAERFRVAVCGFVRDGAFNVYSHGWRIDSAAE